MKQLGLAVHNYLTSNSEEFPMTTWYLGRTCGQERSWKSIRSHACLYGATRTSRRYRPTEHHDHVHNQRPNGPGTPRVRNTVIAGLVCPSDSSTGVVPTGVQNANHAFSNYRHNGGPIIMGGGSNNACGPCGTNYNSFRPRSGIGNANWGKTFYEGLPASLGGSGSQGQEGLARVVAGIATVSTTPPVWTRQTCTDKTQRYP